MTTEPAEPLSEWDQAVDALREWDPRFKPPDEMYRQLRTIMRYDEHLVTIDALTAERDRYRDGLELFRRIVDEQAEDDGLWFKAIYITEAYLQQELRKLHAAIESISPSEDTE